MFVLTNLDRTRCLAGCEESFVSLVDAGSNLTGAWIVWKELLLKLVILCQYNSQIHRVPAGRIVTNKQTHTISVSAGTIACLPHETYICVGTFYVTIKSRRAIQKYGSLGAISFEKALSAGLL
jgi:hypothetical protein